MQQLEFYKKTVELMIGLYCRNRHRHPGTGKVLCSDCLHLKQYSELKLDNCVYGKDKPPCSICRTHCFKPVMRAKIREVMKYSGKRMLFYHPVIAIKYLCRKSGQGIRKEK